MNVFASHLQAAAREAFLRLVSHESPTLKADIARVGEDLEQLARDAIGEAAAALWPAVLSATEPASPEPAAPAEEKTPKRTSRKPPPEKAPAIGGGSSPLAATDLVLQAPTMSPTLPGVDAPGVDAPSVKDDAGNPLPPEALA